MYPKVSIVISTYNQKEFISDAIDSALIVDYYNKEIIVSDDCSPDGTYDFIVEKYKTKNIKIFKNEKNLGRVMNYRRTLYERVTGEWVIYLDGDDYFTCCNFIKDSFSLLTQNVIAVCWKILPVRFAKDRYCIFKAREIFIKWYNWQINHSCIIYNVSDARKADFYKADIISSDWESLLRLFLTSYKDVVIFSGSISHWRFTGRNESINYVLNNRIRNFSFINRPYELANSLKLFNRCLLFRWKFILYDRQIRGFIYNNSLHINNIFVLVLYIIKTAPWNIISFLNIGVYFNKSYKNLKKYVNVWNLWHRK